MSSIRLRPACPEDLKCVEALLSEAGLPLAGLSDQFPAAFAVACDEESVIGVAGLELHGGVGLLRSLVIMPRYRSQRLGQALVLDRVAAARTAKVAGIYLLTNTAEDYMTQLGFVQVPRSQAPEVLQCSVEFASACPITATCMVLWNSIVLPSPIQGGHS